MKEEVVLVDCRDREVGTLEKLAAHKCGALHRAVSVFVFHSDGRLMLQRRALGKYHSAGRWSNTCCSHPQPGESTAVAAARRLQEEMGLQCPITAVHVFRYRAEFENGLIEHEYDHVFVGVGDRNPVLNLSEADDWKWIGIKELRRDIAAHPERYTYWLRMSLDDVIRTAELNDILRI